MENQRVFAWLVWFGFSVAFFVFYYSFEEEDIVRVRDPYWKTEK